MACQRGGQAGLGVGMGMGVPVPWAGMAAAARGGATQPTAATPTSNNSSALSAAGSNHLRALMAVPFLTYLAISAATLQDRLAPASHPSFLIPQHLYRVAPADRTAPDDPGQHPSPPDQRVLQPRPNLLHPVAWLTD